MAIVGVVGLPGSGKTTLIKQYAERGFAVFDDIGRNGNWTPHPEAIRAAAAAGDVIVSDILFCCDSSEEAAEFFRQTKLGIRGFQGRLDFMQRVGLPIEWIFFENDPTQCEKNCRVRYQGQPSRNVAFEIWLIQILSGLYHPPAGSLPVVVASARK